MDRTERLYKLRLMLLAHRSVKLIEMKQELQVSRATLYRDLNYMRDRLGMPLAYQAELRGYVMIPQRSNKPRYELPGIWFNQQELCSLLTLVEVVSKIGPNAPLLSYLGPLKTRLQNLFDDGTTYPITARQRISIVPSTQSPHPSEHFQIITVALNERKRLNIKYVSRRTGHATRRDLSPQRLVYYRDNWHLDAFCHLRQGLRRFALGAIPCLSLIEQTAHDISDREWHEISATNYNTLPSTEQRIATLKFTPFKAQWVAHEVWHPKQLGTLSADGSYILKVPYGNDRELIQDILGHGSEVQVLCPLALKKKVADTIKEMMSIYSQFF